MAAQIRGGIESIWLFDIARGTPARWTTEWDNAAPIWDLTGPQIIFTSPRPSAFDLYRQPVEGGNAERIVSSEFTKFPDSWSPDGTTLAYTEQGDIFTVRLVAGATPTPFANSEARERSATFSPSGAWVAYVSDESGRGRSVRATISRGRGAAGRYRSRAAPIRSGIQTERSSSTGRASEMMTIAIQEARTMVVARPQLLYERRFGRSLDDRFDVTPDGRYFIDLDDAVAEPPPTEVVLVQHFANELKRLAPPGR